MDDNFMAAFAELLAFEGGYVNDPDDPGGETNFGISKRSYPDVDIKNLTRMEAGEIYYKDWWLKYGYDKISDQAIAQKVFSLSVNMGPNKAHNLLQIAVSISGGNRLELDGIIGPKTIKGINTHPLPEYLTAIYKLVAIEYYTSLDNAKFSRGWIRRALA